MSIITQNSFSSIKKMKPLTSHQIKAAHPPTLKFASGYNIAKKEMHLFCSGVKGGCVRTSQVGRKFGLFVFHLLHPRRGSSLRGVNTDGPVLWFGP